MKKGILNIELDAYVPLNKNIKSQGRATPIRYWDEIAHTKIEIYSYNIMWSDILLHELAHVAVL